MKNPQIKYSKPFTKDVAKLPPSIREALFNKITLFIKNPSHPSLRVKRMKEHSTIWEMNITMNYRLTFEIDPPNFIKLRKIGTHDILKNP